MTVGIGEKVEFEAAKKEQKRAKTKEKMARLRLKIKKDEEKCKDYRNKMEYIEDKHLGRLKTKVEHLNNKIKALQYSEIEIRGRRDEGADVSAAKRDTRKAKREKHIARYKLKIAHVNDRMKYYVTKMKYIEEKHIARLKARIEKHKDMIKDLEHTAKW